MTETTWSAIRHIEKTRHGSHYVEKLIQIVSKVNDKCNSQRKLNIRAFGKILFIKWVLQYGFFKYAKAVTIVCTC